jgi:hypothetical protein
MLIIVLLVCFVVVMLLWFLSMMGAVPNATTASPWLAFIACLILGIVVFLTGSGISTMPRGL